MNIEILIFGVILLYVMNYTGRINTNRFIADNEVYFRKLKEDDWDFYVRAKYGDGLIKEYSERLIIELNDKKYSYRNLMNMRKFYLLFRDKKVNALRSQLSWNHYR